MGRSTGRACSSTRRPSLPTSASVRNPARGVGLYFPRGGLDRLAESSIARNRCEAQCGYRWLQGAVMVRQASSFRIICSQGLSSDGIHDRAPRACFTGAVGCSAGSPCSHPADAKLELSKSRALSRGHPNGAFDWPECRSDRRARGLFTNGTRLFRACFEFCFTCRREIRSR
jgi:hypothetical protein